MSHSCSICFEEYDSNKRTPKFLECGHTLCCSCLFVQYKSSRTCPLCRALMTKERAENYPTAFQLLPDVLQTNASNSQSQGVVQKIRTKLQDTKKSYERELMSIENRLRLNAKELNSNRSNIRDYEKKLDAMNKRLAEVHKTTAELEQSTVKFKERQKFLYKELEAINKMLGDPGRSDYSEQLLDLVEGQLQNLSLNASGEASRSSELRLCDFVNSDEYLHEICSRIEHGELVFAWHQRQGKTFYSKVLKENGEEYLNEVFLDEFPNGCILVGSLTLSHVEDSSALLIPFRDLKSIAEPRFTAFLKYKYVYTQQEEFIHLYDSPLARQFLTLCTGEEGPTYKGGRMKWNGLFWKLNHYQINGTDASGCLLSTNSLPTEKFFSLSPWTLEGFSDGSFQKKFYTANHSSSNVLSIQNHCFTRWVPSSNPYDDIISDCGLVLEC